MNSFTTKTRPMLLPQFPPAMLPRLCFLQHTAFGRKKSLKHSKTSKQSYALAQQPLTLGAAMR